MRILLISSDKATASFIRSALGEEQYLFDTLIDSSNAIKQAMVENGTFALIIHYCHNFTNFSEDLYRQLRQDDPHTPVLIMSSKYDLDELERFLEAGVDDYLAKPIAKRELKARVKALWRRRYRAQVTYIDCGELVLNLDEKILLIRRKKVRLSSLQYRLLYAFMLNQNKVLSRQDIADRVWGNSSEGINSNTLDVHIMNLRKILAQAGAKRDYIFTIRGEGYMMDCSNSKKQRNSELKTQ